MKKFSTAAAILFTVLGVFSAQAKLNPEKASKMEYKQFGSQYFIRINPGQELVSTLKEFCKAKKITLATVSGIGSLKSVTLGFFNPESKKYDQKTFNCTCTPWWPATTTRPLRDIWPRLRSA